MLRIGSIMATSEQPSTPPKRFIICCDGTWQSAISGRKTSPSNVTRLYRNLAHVGKDSDGKVWQQILWYDSGIGTSSYTVDKLIEGATGLGLDHNIRQAYTFLAENYAAGDQVFCFGFSRGAYTARALAGFISDVGICERGQLQHLPKVWQLYKQTKPGERFLGSDKYWAFVEEPVAASTGSRDRKYRWKMPEVRKWYSRAESREIEVVGVFDTVGALGLPAICGFDIQRHFGLDEHCFHNVALNRSIKRAFHALALDEHREAFSPTLWRLPEDYPFAGKDITAKHDEFEHVYYKWLEVYDNGNVSPSERRQIHSDYIKARGAITALEKEAIKKQREVVAKLEYEWTKTNEKAMSRGEWEKAKKPYNEARTLLIRMNEYNKPPPELLQVWFPGMHLNVGGGDDAALRGEGDLEELSNITFAWMLDQIRPHLAIDYESTSDEARARQAELDALNKRHEDAAVALQDRDANWADEVRQWLQAMMAQVDGAAAAKARRYYGWGTGPIVDSYRGVYRVNGSTPRTPGAYFRDGAGPDTGRTREYVHPVVGWRMHLTLYQAMRRCETSTALLGREDVYRPLGFDDREDGEVERRPRGRGGWEYTFPGGVALPEYRIRPSDKRLVVAYDGEPALEEDAAWYDALDGRPSFERQAITDQHSAGDPAVDREHVDTDEHAKAYVRKLDRENGYCNDSSVDGKRLRCPECGCT